MMSNKLPPVEVLIFPNDTQWAIAAKVPIGMLDAARCELSEFLQTDGSRAVPGNKGMSVLLVFGGSAGEGEDLAIELSRKHKTSGYLLDFDDEAYSIRQFDRELVQWKDGYPAEFLESHGVTAPGYEPLPEPTITVIGVVDDVTLEQAYKAMPKVKEQLTANARGVLVKDVLGITTLKLSRKLKRHSFTLFYDRADGSFTCLIRNRTRKPRNPSRLEKWMQIPKQLIQY